MAKILIIEDAPETQKFLRVILERGGHEILQAMDGEQGVTMANEVCPDVILTDLLLPRPPAEMDLLRKLREDLPECPIVVISGYPSPERMEECARLGVTDFLTKPFEVGFVTDVVKRLTGQD